MAQISEKDLKTYASAIHEIGEVALQHAENTPRRAQFFLELAVREHTPNFKVAYENEDGAHYCSQSGCVWCMAQEDFNFWMRDQANIFKEIGEVALRHAGNNPAGAEFLLQLTAKIHKDLSKKEMSNNRISAHSLN